MRRSLIALVLTAGALVGVLRYRTPPVKTTAKPYVPPPITPPPTTSTTAAPTATVPTTAAPTTAASITVTSTTAATTTTSTSTTTTLAEVVATGPAETVPDPGTSYRYGLVQLRVTFRGPRMIAIDPIRLPPDGDTSPPSTYQVSKSDSDYAAPILVHEALQAQSSQIQAVSGATYTSDAFRASLQAAIDQTHR